MAKVVHPNSIKKHFKKYLNMKKLFLVPSIILASFGLSANAQSYDDVYDTYNPAQSTTGNSNTNQQQTQIPFEPTQQEQTYYQDDYGNGSTFIDYNDDDYYYSSYINRFYSPYSGFGYFSNCYSNPYAWGWGNNWNSWNNPYGFSSGYGWNGIYINFGSNPWNSWVNPYYNTYNSWGYSPWYSFGGYGGYNNYCGYNGWGNNFYNNYYFGNYYGNSWGFGCGNGYGGYGFGGYNNGFNNGYYNGYYNGYNNGYNNGFINGNNDTYHYGPRQSSYTFANLNEYKATGQVVNDRISPRATGAPLGGNGNGGVKSAPNAGRNQYMNTAPVPADRMNTAPVRNNNGGMQQTNPGAAPIRDIPAQRYNDAPVQSSPRNTSPQFNAPTPRQEAPRYEAPVQRREEPRQQYQTPAPRQEAPRYEAPVQRREEPRQQYQTPAPRQESSAPSRSNDTPSRSFGGRR
jgi:hypothetical protein